ncbi:MAG: peptidoglycan bridge formation glycyltransferase FemA/FemB family protein [Candidatus Zixiibacteriota bacterium]|nr:MAG: peptidoglycan bridge formation glycyltransferase FemA/FemB family protein [candidate division Zixibacteria bacterium]
MNLIVLEEPDEKWDDFVSAHSRLIFHTSTWRRILRESFRCPTRYLVFEEEGDWLCGLPGMMAGNRFFRVFYSLIPYGGFIGDRERIPECLRLLNNWAKNERIQRIQIVDVRIKNKRDLPDFKCVESYRHVLQLEGKTTDQIWKGYRGGLKRNIKAAMKSELCFERIGSREEIGQFYKLYLDSMSRNKALAKYPLQLFLKIYDLLVPTFCDVFFVRYRGQPIAGAVIIYSEDTAHYFHGGSATDYLHLRPNDLLFHHAIGIARERENSYFDFFGSDKRLASLIRFKEKWGTTREELFNFHKDFGSVRPFLFKTALSLAQTPLGSALHRGLKSMRKESPE